MKDDYKNGDTLVFRGLTYKYNSHFGEWHLKTKLKKGFKDTRPQTPITVHSMSDAWWAGNYSGKTPEQALERWRNGVLDAARNAVKDLMSRVRAHEQIIELHESKRWSGRKRT